jgi:hypothetical protein
MKGLGELPSGTSATRLVAGESGALPEVIFHTALRAGLIGAGMYLAGSRKNTMRNALAGSVAIETFVLLWALHERG